MWCGGKIYLLVEFYHVAVKFYHHFSLNLGILEILLSLILRNIKHTHFSPKKSIVIISMTIIKLLTCYTTTYLKFYHHFSENVGILEINLKIYRIIKLKKIKIGQGV